MIDLLIVALEPMWPPRQGGQVRMAGIIEALSEDLSIVVAIPESGGMLAAPVPVYSLHRSESPNHSFRGFFSALPRIGHMLAATRSGDQIRNLVEELQPRAVLFSHQYLATMAGTIDVPVIIDFQNLETRRLATFARRGTLRNRASATVEALKARRWEPALARRVHLCLALDPVDCRELQRWGARTIIVPNGVSHRSPLIPSPHRGPVVYFASGDYAPNRDGGSWLLSDVWPKVLERDPEARLIIAGRATLNAYPLAASVPSVTLLGEVDHVSHLLDCAAVLVAPVSSGGGQQLKVIEALSRARIVVATPFSARSVPEALRDLCIVANDSDGFSAALVETLSDAPARWNREKSAFAAVQLLPTWRQSVAPLVSWIEALS
jgi:glycosyltransferase involved in cell wall biosynthesis